MRTKIFISALLLIAIAFSVTGCDRMMPVEYFEFGIVLDVSFESYDSDGAFDVAYANGDVIMGMTRYSFVDCEEYGLLSTLSPDKLAEVYRDKSGKGEECEIMKTADVPYYFYSTADGFTYLMSFYRTPYAYFVVTYITPTAKFDEVYDDILDYMSSAYILQEHI
jgi:hypothetical protein